MPDNYEIRYTNSVNKSNIVVEDKGKNIVDTSLVFPGRYYPDYGQDIAENFLHILENFANTSPPSNPVEGQLWYDTTSGIDQLKVYDGTMWVSASGLKKSTVEPPLSGSSTGDLWVNTETQQLYLFTGSIWSLIGPEFSGGLFTGNKVETLVDVNNASQTVFSIKVNDQPLAILSQTTFVPKSRIAGFEKIYAGITLSTLNSSKYYGTAEKSENLVVGQTVVPASNFLRSDQVSSTNYKLNIRNNSGLEVGTNSQLLVKVEGDSGIIQNVVAGASIDVRMRNGTANLTAIKIKSNGNIGLGNIDPDDKLSVVGNIRITPTTTDSTTGKLFVGNTDDATGINSGALVTKGGIGVAKNLWIGGATFIAQNLTTADIVPDAHASRNIGSSLKTYNEIHATTIIGNVKGDVTGTLAGRADSANKLTNTTTFLLTGDVQSNSIAFDGQTGGQTKTFDVTIKNSFIANRDIAYDAAEGDEILINKTSGNTGLFRISKSNFIKTIPTTPVGTISQYAGQEAPEGWLLCDGAVLKKTEYNALWKVIQHSFRPASTLSDQTFALPDFRGRFALGLDNMGGPAAGRVSGNYSASTLGNVGGDTDVIIQTDNLPEHTHDLKGDANSQFYAVRTNSEAPIDTDAIDLQIASGAGGTQGIPTSGNIVRDPLIHQQPMYVMNPYLAINYIIYTGV